MTRLLTFLLFVAGVCQNSSADPLRVRGSIDQRGATLTLPNQDVTPNEEFEIGSITKSFTGILLIELEQEHKLNLEDPVEKFLPELKDTFIGDATLLQLATHTSGLPRGNWADLFNPACVECFHPERRDPYNGLDWEHVRRFLVSFHPTEQMRGRRRYSNVAFMILGEVLGRVENKTYNEMLRSRITSVLGMNATGLNIRERNRVQGFSKDQQPIGRWTISQTAAPALGISSTPEDMIKYLDANLHPPRTALGRAILRSQELGIGWDSTPHAPVVWKNGSTAGFSSLIEIDQEAGRAFFELRNLGESMPFQPF